MKHDTIEFRRQRTIRESTTIRGIGYWSGRDVSVTLHPAGPDTGIVFVRSDLAQPVRIPAHVDNRVEIPRRTILRVGGITIEMVEHILAALNGLRIDNCEIHVDSVEMPGLDGSCKAIVDSLLSAGMDEQDRTRQAIVISDVTRVGTEECWVEARPLRASERETVVRYYLDFGLSSPIGRQRYELTITPDSFATELAPARTFLLREEAEWLRQKGLGQRTTARDLLVFDGDGPIDNELRFTDECVRHKALDLVGDLALCGCDLYGYFVGHRSGHRLNAELVRVLLAENASKLFRGQMTRSSRRMSA